MFFPSAVSDQRITAIQFVKKELEQKLEEIIVEIDALIVLQSRVGKALEATKEPLRVTMLCLEERLVWIFISQRKNARAIASFQ